MLEAVDSGGDDAGAGGKTADDPETRGIGNDIDLLQRGGVGGLIDDQTKFAPSLASSAEAGTCRARG